MNDYNLSDLLKLVPNSLHSWLVAGFLVSHFAGRIYQALSTGGGLKGVLSAIWLGTNTPKKDS